VSIGIHVAILASYFLGAIPTSYWVVRAVKGIDLRTVGSGNLGATNLYRLMGWKYAIPVAAFDVLKGAIPVWVFAPMAGLGELGAVGLGLMAVLGHVFSVFVSFRGGKGVATGGGVILGLAPWAFLVSLVIWIVTVRLSGYVSLGSVLGALSLPAAVLLLHPERSGDFVAAVGCLTALVVWLHRANLRRLMAGTEHRFGRRAGAAHEGDAA
jgi:glycerol-3-phosphate acyltransferase PlsY